MKRNTVMTWALVTASLPLVACGPTTTESGDDDGAGTGPDLAKIAIANTEHALVGSHSAGSFIADSQTFADAFSSLDGGEDCESSGCSGTDPACVPTEVCTPDEVTIAELQETRTDLREAIDEFITNLRDEIFAPANLESKTASSATYRLGPSVLCAEVVEPGVPGEPPPAAPTTPMYDPECVDEANRLEVRLRLTLASPGNVDMAVQLTAAKRTPVTFELHQDHLQVSSDLAEVKATLEAAGEDTSAIPTLEGKIGFELRQNAEIDWSLLGHVYQNVVVVVENDAAEQVRVGVGASSPATELRLNGNAKNILGSIDYGAISVGGPLNAFRDSFDEVEYDPLTGDEIPRPTYTGNVELMLAGYEGSVTFDGSTDHLALKGLGMGDVASTLKWNDQILAQFDLNPMNGRHFNLGYQKTNAGSEFTFSPTFDALIRLNFAPLANQITDISPSLLDDNIRLWFDGQDPKIEVTDEQVKVVTGTFNLTSTATPEANLSVPAGMCIVSSGATDPANGAIGDAVMGACQ
jgi:hypothetical protein